MSKEITKIFRGQANYGRTANMTLIEEEVEFDVSDEEYGPIRFPLKVLEKALSEHLTKMSRRNFTELKNQYKKL